MGWPRTPFWVWPNLLSLDAPLIALSWWLLFARGSRVAVDPVSAILLVVTVWLIYVADRTLDAWGGERRSPRHEFHQKYWPVLLPLWVSALACAGWLAWTRLDAASFRVGLALLSAVLVYLVAVHRTVRAGTAREPKKWKEAAVGILFALGVSQPVWSRGNPALPTWAVVVFAGLCWLNCAMIEKWEGADPHWSPLPAALLLSGAAGLLTLSRQPMVAGAEALSSLGLCVAGAGRYRFSREALRVLPDVALLSPVIFLIFAR